MNSSQAHSSNSNIIKTQESKESIQQQPAIQGAVSFGRTLVSGPASGENQEHDSPVDQAQLQHIHVQSSDSFD